MGIRMWWHLKYRKPKITKNNFWDTDLKDIDKALDIDRSKMPIAMHVGGIKVPVDKKDS